MADGQRYTVVGIMPASLSFPLSSTSPARSLANADIWQPLGFTDAEMKRRGSRSYG
jgi:hypothetical protein